MNYTPENAKDSAHYRLHIALILYSVQITTKHAVWAASQYGIDTPDDLAFVLTPLTHAIIAQKTLY